MKPSAPSLENYAEFLKNRETDPTGYETLKRILKSKDMEKFQRDWEKYVLKLKYP